MTSNILAGGMTQPVNVNPVQNPINPLTGRPFTAQELAALTPAQRNQALSGIPAPDVNQLTGGQPVTTLPVNPAAPAVPELAPGQINPQTGQPFTPQEIAVLQSGGDPNAAVTIDNTTGQVIPPTGLIGAEEALVSGAQGATGAIIQGFDVGATALEQGRAGALGALDTATQAVTGATQQARTDILSGAETGQNIIQQAVTGGVGAVTGAAQGAQDILSGTETNVLGQLDQAATGIQGAGDAALGAVQTAGITTQNLINDGVAALETGKAEGLAFLNQAFDQAVDPISGFIDPGQQAQVLQAALTGALGPEAQRAAIDNFITDPGTLLAVREAEQALLRNASATGGLGGGRVRKALVRESVGNSLKNFNTRIDQLGRQAALGFNAATAVGSLRSQQGVAGLNLIGQTSQGIANLRESGAGFASLQGRTEADIFRGTAQDIARLRETGALASLDLGGLSAQIEQTTGQTIATLLQSGAITEADIVQSASNSIANIAQQGGFAEADIATKSALIEQATGRDLATLANSTGVNIANILENLGSSSAELRTQAGRDLAAAIGQTSAQLAGLQEAQGTGISDIVSTNIANIANLLLQEGLLDSESDQQLAVLLANLAVGQGSTSAQIAASIGEIEAAGILGTNSAVQGGIDGLLKLLGKKSTKEKEE